jgi:WD40 repeat protein
MRRYLRFHFAYFSIRLHPRRGTLAITLCQHARASVSTNRILTVRRLVTAAVCILAIGVQTSRAAQPAATRAVRVLHCGADAGERPTVVTGIAVTPDGHTIAAATDDHHVSIWDAASGSLKASFAGHSDWVHSVVLSRDGATAISGANDCALCMWNLSQPQPVFEAPSGGKTISSVALHPNGQQLAVVGFSKKLEIVNTSTGQVSQEIDGPCVDVRTVVFSSRGDRMAAAGRNGKIRIWNVDNGKKLADIVTNDRRIRALAFSPDGMFIAAAGDGPSIGVFEVATGKTFMTLASRPAKIYSLVYLDSQHLATGGSDNRVTIWDLDSRQADSHLEGHTGTVAALACDSTGRILVSGSYDTTIRIWDRAAGSPATAWRGKEGGKR